MTVFKVKDSSIMKGGVLNHDLRKLDLPSWLTARILRVLDRLIFFMPILKNNPNGNEIFDYIVKKSGVKDFPFFVGECGDNPIKKLYATFSAALMDADPYRYFINRVSLENDVVIITD